MVPQIIVNSSLGLTQKATDLCYVLNRRIAISIRNWNPLISGFTIIE